MSFALPKMPVQGFIDIQELPPGEYKLMVEVGADGQYIQFARESKFIVFQAPDDVRFRDYEGIIEELKIIADREEWKFLRKLNTLDFSMKKDYTKSEVQQQAIDEFWKKRDPTQNTVRNEIKIEFYKRLNTARQLYRVNNHHLSDRGKVYVLFGAPDQILRSKSGNPLRSIETWKYNSNSTEVIFQDNFGIGNFLLVWPDDLFSTK